MARFEVIGDTKTLISCAEQLTWLTAIFRVPVYGQVSYSTVSFTSKTNGLNEQYEISPLILQKVEESPGACWLPLFQNSIIALGFPVPDRAEEKGIELPFSLMTDQAGILYSTTHNEGLYLKGFSTLIYPSAASENLESVQWHVISSGDSRERVAPGTVPLASTINAENGEGWVRSTDFTKLASARRTFLGYCKNVVVHLATSESTKPAILNRVRHSKANDESPRPGPLLKTISTGFPGAGIASVMFGVDIVRPQGLTHAAKNRKDDGFLGMCEYAKDTPVILYDEKKDCGWLVPTLSAVLHMAHLWARDKPQLLAQVPQADACWDAGEAALTVIKKHPALIIRHGLQEEESTSLRDLIQRFLVSLDEKTEIEELSAKDPKPTVKIESSKLYGWDLLDIVEKRRSKRRQLSVNEGWTILSESVLVLLCQNLGEIIRPAADASVCRAWNPIPPKHRYLTATVKCLQQMATQRGGHDEDPCFKLTSHGFWASTSDNLFADCRPNVQQPLTGRRCHCAKQPQHIVAKESAAKGAGRPPDTGAVVFGTRKLQREHHRSVIKAQDNQRESTPLADSNGLSAGVSVGLKKKRTGWRYIVRRWI